MTFVLKFIPISESERSLENIVTNLVEASIDHIAHPAQSTPFGKSRLSVPSTNGFCLKRFLRCIILYGSSLFGISVCHFALKCTNELRKVIRFLKSSQDLLFLSNSLFNIFCMQVHHIFVQA